MGPGLLARVRRPDPAPGGGRSGADGPEGPGGGTWWWDRRTVCKRFFLTLEILSSSYTFPKVIEASGMRITSQVLLGLSPKGRSSWE